MPYTRFTRKPVSIDEISKHGERAWVDITDTVLLPINQYNNFCQNLQNDYSFLEGKGGFKTQANIPYGRTAVLVTCPGKPSLVVDPSGYSYARYVGFEEE